MTNTTIANYGESYHNPHTGFTPTSQLNSISGSGKAKNHISKVTLEKNSIFPQNSTIAIDREFRKPLGFAPSSRNQRHTRTKVTLKPEAPPKYRLTLRELREDGSIDPEIYHEELISEAQAKSGQYIPKIIQWNSQRTDSGLLPLVSKLEKLGGEA